MFTIQFTFSGLSLDFYQIHEIYISTLPVFIPTGPGPPGNGNSFFIITTNICTKMVNEELLPGGKINTLH
jgi:hypothetical protein